LATKIPESNCLLSLLALLWTLRQITAGSCPKD
jgi:hypothetical protein